MLEISGKNEMGQNCKVSILPFKKIQVALKMMQEGIIVMIVNDIFQF
jgi:hypothetical protein